MDAKFRKILLYLAISASILFYFVKVVGGISVYAQGIDLAIAANLSQPMHKIAADFQEETGLVVHIASGATQSLAAQIIAGAPFDLFFAADVSTPLNLIEKGLADKNSLKIYAHGRLALALSPHFSQKLDSKIRKALPQKVNPLLPKTQWLELDTSALHLLFQQPGKMIALSDPTLAPYGKAAQAILLLKGIDPISSKQIIYAANQSLVISYLLSNNVDIGFLALSQALPASLEWWLIPSTLHAPIEQGYVIINNKVRSNLQKKELQRFINYFNSQQAQKVLVAYGYE